MNNKELAAQLSEAVGGRYVVSGGEGKQDFHIPGIPYAIASLVGGELKFHPLTDKQVKALFKIALEKINGSQS